MELTNLKKLDDLYVAKMSIKNRIESISGTSLAGANISTYAPTLQGSPYHEDILINGDSTELTMSPKLGSVVTCKGDIPSAEYVYSILNTSCYGKCMVFTKKGYIDPDNIHYYDSAIFYFSKKIDLINYNHMLIEYGIGINTTEVEASLYYKFSDTEPEVPSSSSLYDWTDWKLLVSTTNPGGLLSDINNPHLLTYITNIDNIDTSKYLCIGVHHGSENTGYNACGFIRKLILY